MELGKWLLLQWHIPSKEEDKSEIWNWNTSVLEDGVRTGDFRVGITGPSSYLAEKSTLKSNLAQNKI